MVGNLTGRREWSRCILRNERTDILKQHADPCCLSRDMKTRAVNLSSVVLTRCVAAANHFARVQRGFSEGKTECILLISIGAENRATLRLQNLFITIHFLNNEQQISKKNPMIADAVMTAAAAIWKRT